MKSVCFYIFTFVLLNSNMMFKIIQNAFLFRKNAVSLQKIPVLQQIFFNKHCEQKKSFKINFYRYF